MDAKQIMALLGILGAFCTVCDCSPAEGRCLATVMAGFQPTRSVAEIRELYHSFVPTNADEAEGISILKEYDIINDSV